MSLFGDISQGEILLTSAFIAYETSFNFSQFLPSIMTIGTFVDTPEKISMIRQGELVAGGYALAFAALFSVITRSVLPLALSALAISVTIAVYEWALRQAPAWPGKEGDR
jgi:hypothetical protein